MQALAALAGAHQRTPGHRLHENQFAKRLLGKGSSALTLARSLLGNAAVPVRAILFDKNPLTNWSLGWHQDRTIAVKRRIDVRGFETWSKKSGMHHVEPPFALFDKMVTLRLHLDAVDENNAPLLIARGSHKFGRIPVGEIESVVEKSDLYSCIAEPGDIWAYRTPILHASEASKSNRQRRVLQADFCDEVLPGSLEWMGI